MPGLGVFTDELGATLVARTNSQPCNKIKFCYNVVVMLKSPKLTKLDLLLGDLTVWNDETRQQARAYVDNHCTRFHLVWLVELAGHNGLNEGWPSRAELLEVVNLVDPQELLRAWHKLEAVRSN